MIVDAAMNDLIRPTLYEAHHDIVPVHQRPSAPTAKVDVVGPVCETGDYLALDRELPELMPRRPHRGDDRRRLWRGAGVHLQHTGRSSRKCW